jgi:hypothetical protein
MRPGRDVTRDSLVFSLSALGGKMRQKGPAGR